MVKRRTRRLSHKIRDSRSVLTFQIGAYGSGPLQLKQPAPQKSARAARGDQNAQRRFVQPTRPTPMKQSTAAPGTGTGGDVACFMTAHSSKPSFVWFGSPNAEYRYT